MINEEVKEIFKFFDSSGDMKIPTSEVGIPLTAIEKTEFLKFGKCLRALGQTPTEAQCQNFTRKFDQKGKSQITVEEFIPIVYDLIAEQKTKKQCGIADYVEMFALMDRAGNGVVRYTDLKHLLTHAGERLSDEELEQTLIGFISDDGQVQYERYIERICDSNT